MSGYERGALSWFASVSSQAHAMIFLISTYLIGAFLEL